VTGNRGISLVFREMWDSTTLNPSPSILNEYLRVDSFESSRLSRGNQRTHKQTLHYPRTWVPHISLVFREMWDSATLTLPAPTVNERLPDKPVPIDPHPKSSPSKAAD
jgi:hypothetical protein